MSNRRARYRQSAAVCLMPDLSRYELTKAEVVTNYMSVPCFLVTHPKGTLMWDVGVVPDKDLKPDGAP